MCDRCQTHDPDESRRIATAMRAALERTGTLAIRLSGPAAAGKTSLVLATATATAKRAWRIALLAPTAPPAALAAKLLRAGVRVRALPQPDCWLDAQSVSEAIDGLDVSGSDVLFFEDRAMTDASIGEAVRATVLSFQEAATLGALPPCDLVVLTHLDQLKTRHPDGRDSAARVIALSLVTGEGLPSWVRWLEEQRHALSMRVESAP